MHLIKNRGLDSAYNSSEAIHSKFSSIEAALADIRSGRLVIVIDDESWQQGGHLICAAQFVTPQIINTMTIWANSPLYLAMEDVRIDELNLNSRTSDDILSQENILNTPGGIDIGHIGLSSGTVSEKQARAVQDCLNHEIKPKELHYSGQVFPLGAKSGGVFVSAGQAEAAVDMAQLAGLYPAGLICDIPYDFQSFTQSKEQSANLLAYAQHQEIKVISMTALINYRLQRESIVTRIAVSDFPSEFGNFKIYGYRNSLDQTEHLAMLKGNEKSFRQYPVMVRVHSECLTGDAFGSLRCDCRAQLYAAMQMIEDAGRGVLIYLRQEGRGIGLVNKVKAYSLQDLGLDTVEANEELGFKPDLRNYGIGAQILKELGIRDLSLITNNPRKISGLKSFGLNVIDRIPLITDINTHNARYLSSKAQKLGHLLDK